MAKHVGFEVTARKPVCVDFPDGRVVSFRPGMRFKAHPTNASVRRLIKVREIRQLGPYEAVPSLPVKLGAPREVQNVLKAREQVAAARKAALTKLKATKAAPLEEKVLDLGSVNQPTSRPAESE